MTLLNLKKRSATRLQRFTFTHHNYGIVKCFFENAELSDAIKRHSLSAQAWLIWSGRKAGLPTRSRHHLLFLQMNINFHSRIFGPHDVAICVTYCLHSNVLAAELCRRENWMCFSIVCSKLRLSYLLAYAWEADRTMSNSKARLALKFKSSVILWQSCYQFFVTCIQAYGRCESNIAAWQLELCGSISAQSTAQRSNADSTLLLLALLRICGAALVRVYTLPEPVQKFMLLQHVFSMDLAVLAWRGAEIDAGTNKHSCCLWVSTNVRRCRIQKAQTSFFLLRSLIPAHIRRKNKKQKLLACTQNQISRKSLLSVLLTGKQRTPFDTSPCILLQSCIRPVIGKLLIFRSAPTQNCLFAWVDPW